MVIFCISKKFPKRIYVLRMKITLPYPQLLEDQEKGKMGFTNNLIEDRQKKFRTDFILFYFLIP